MTDVRQIGYGSERGYVRDIPGGVVHLASRDDTTQRHAIYPCGYDLHCSWCWLGYSHSEAAHAQSIDA
jgi:hypothetical protein